MAVGRGRLIARLFTELCVATCCETRHLRFYLPALAKHAGARAKTRRNRFHLLFMQQYLFI